MEEKKKEIKTGLSTASLLIILAIIVIIIMGYLIFKLNNDIQNQNIMINDLNSQISTFSNQVIELNDQNNKLNTQITELNNQNNDYKEKMLNTNEEIPVNETDKSTTINNPPLLDYEELFYCEDVIKNKDNSYTFKGAICKPYTITTEDFKEMLKKEKIVLEENNLSNRLKNNECIIKKLDETNYMPYEVLSFEDSKHFCYIAGNDEEGYRLDLGTEFSTIWKKTNDIREYTFPSNAYYLDLESLGYANNMSKEEIEKNLNTIYAPNEEIFKTLIGSYLKFRPCVYSVTEGVTSFH